MRRHDPQQVWEDSWSSPPATDAFLWRTSEAPRELDALLRSGGIPDGPAVDMGCGDGVLTKVIAEWVTPTIGFDFAVGAVRRAVATASRPGLYFLAAEVPHVPIAAGSVAFVFDRGCLQQVPRELWPAYFAEVRRILKPRGVLQLYCCRGRRAPAGVVRFLRWAAAELRAALRARRKQPSRSLIAGLAGGLVVEEIREFVWDATDTFRPIFIYGLFRKAADE